ncbi:Uncharacterized protein Adt_21126 [Abeliophyllum distichum]|uniref:Uncharacterized protein n=1 Tax=Abeliophyllum distichum TaxID=126358 RepID=A0ABD1SYK6_9LAMI
MKSEILKREYFTPFATREERITNCPDKDHMKELANKATEESSSMYSLGHDDVFTQVIGPDTRGRKRCFGRATFFEELSNTIHNRDNLEVRSLKGKVVDVE